MMKTNRHTITKFQYFLIQYNLFARKRWWFFAALVLLLILGYALAFNEWVNYYLSCFVLFYPFYYAVVFYRTAYAKGNEDFYAERHVELSSSKLTFVINDQTKTEVGFSTIQQIKKIGAIYLIYFKAGQFYFLPENAFVTQGDLDWFKKNYVDRIDMKFKKKKM